MLFDGSDVLFDTIIGWMALFFPNVVEDEDSRLGIAVTRAPYVAFKFGFVI